MGSWCADGGAKPIPFLCRVRVLDDWVVGIRVMQPRCEVVDSLSQPIRPTPLDGLVPIGDIQSVRDSLDRCVLLL